jgi:DNA mismatch endonuclease (patch repair protein)
MGLRYRVDRAPLPGNKRSRADLVFTRAKVAVFIDGCFWHGCPQHHTFASTNAAFWRAKAEGNRARDERTNAALRDAGWTVLRFWEHQDPHTVANAIREAVLSVQ